MRRNVVMHTSVLAEFTVPEPIVGLGETVESLRARECALLGEVQNLQAEKKPILNKQRLAKIVCELAGVRKQLRSAR